MASYSGINSTVLFGGGNGIWTCESTWRRYWIPTFSRRSIVRSTFAVDVSAGLLRTTCDADINSRLTNKTTERISYGDNGSVSVTFRLRKEPRRSHLFFGGAMQRVLKASAPLDERKLDAP
uniref:Uncharacterized protein n=1 Tax=Ascaris lumbricoides TaxID=6252 RepID=A0A0M3HWL1_ASCLU